MASNELKNLHSQYGFQLGRIWEISKRGKSKPNLDDISTDDKELMTRYGIDLSTGRTTEKTRPDFDHGWILGRKYEVASLSERSKLASELDSIGLAPDGSSKPEKTTPAKLSSATTPTNSTIERARRALGLPTQGVIDNALGRYFAEGKMAELPSFEEGAESFLSELSIYHCSCSGCETESDFALNSYPVLNRLEPMAVANWLADSRKIEVNEMTGSILDGSRRVSKTRHMTFAEVVNDQVDKCQRHYRDNTDVGVDGLTTNQRESQQIAFDSAVEREEGDEKQRRRQAKKQRLGRDRLKIKAAGYSGDLKKQAEATQEVQDQLRAEGSREWSAKEILTGELDDDDPYTAAA